MEKYKKTAIAMISKYDCLQCKIKENVDRQSYTHLKWMLDQVIKAPYSSTKMNRWLGYVQGVMIYNKKEEWSVMVSLEDCTAKEYNDIVVSHLTIVNDYLKEQRVLDQQYFFTETLLKQLSKDQINSDDANRLLGIVQGIFVCNDILNVEEERTRTRQIFKGE